MKKILLVDDEPDILELIAEILVERGHEIEVARSGNEAIGKLKSLKFDVVLSDYKMSNGNGMSVLNFVNTLKIRPIFFLLSAQADESRATYLAKGAQFVIDKPFDLDELIEKIEMVFI